MNYNKSIKKYKTIGEVAKELDLIDQQSGKLQTHTIRYWETQFKQIKPFVMAGRRRYYSIENIKTIKLIKSLLKENGLTIKGVKKVLDKKEGTIDDAANFGVYNPINKSTKVIKDKVKNISNIIRELKKIKNG